MSLEDDLDGMDPAEGNDGLLDARVSRGKLLKSAAALGVLALPGALAGTAGAAPTRGSLSAAIKPKRGGVLRVGQVGSGTAETLNPLTLPGGMEVARAVNLYDKLFAFDVNLKPQPLLAASATAKTGARVWQLKLKRGVHFHNGKELTADDVLYTWRFILNPETKSEGMTALEPLDMTKTKKVNKYEIEVHLKRPIGAFPDLLASRHLSIIPKGFTNFNQPNGTGPFKFVSWSPGVQSVFARNPNYFGDGPYVNQLTLISLNDDNARLNALLGGQVDAINQPPISSISSLQQNSSVKVLGARGPGAPSLYMRMDVPPFTDVRVRQAIRLAVDRKVIRDAFLQGRGSIGNDLYGRGFPSYNRGIKQRTYDPDRAKSLLKAAGQEGLTLRLPMRGPTDVLAITFAQAVKGAGINVSLVPTPAQQYWNPQGVYLTKQAPFYETGWPVSFEDQATSALITGAPFLGETAWDYPNWTRDFRRAQGIADADKRNKAYWDLQEPLHDQGGYVVPIFRDQIDAYSAKLHGVGRNPLFPLGYWNFKTWWFA